ncbi:hypothetical protein, partial [Priestia megaterium]|uniref:hypothetical protein n=1 Tax=Priestia megaterium TaxID=1404 RepID=UPI0033926013
ARNRIYYLLFFKKSGFKLFQLNQLEDECAYYGDFKVSHHDMEYKQVTCESYEDAERTVLRLEREGHMHIEEISNQEAYRGDESSYRE